MATEPRSRFQRGRRWLRGLTLAGTALVPALAPPALAQQPRPLPKDVTAEAEKRVVAFIYNTVPVTREELGEFLIARGGMDKIDLLVNRKIIEAEAAKRGVSVTLTEIEAGVVEDMRATEVATRSLFEQIVQQRLGKTMFEFEQDIVRPRLLLSKMCRPQVQATPQELQRAFETKYGEKREAQVVMWPKGKDGVRELSPDVKEIARTKPEEFEKLAAKQPDKRFADVAGRLAPIGRHIDGEDPKVEAALFSLKEGEISQWIDTQTAWVCVRCLKVIPADPKITLDAVRGEIERGVIERKLGPAIPEFFTQLKEAAKPTLTTQVPPRPAADPKAPPLPHVEHPDPRVLALLYGNVPVTREELGEFLIARGGYEKLDTLVNKKIVERAAAERGVTLTPEEVEAGKKNYVAKLGVENVTVAAFVKDILPVRGISEQMWTEDLIKPDLVLGKMCKDRVKVTDDDLRKAFENRYGEKRLAKIILWEKGEFRLAQKQWDEARKSDEAFDRLARAQRNPNLASHAGQVEPIGRNIDAESPLVEQVVFGLQEGELSQLFETPAGIMCVKCVRKLPAAPGVTLEMVRAQLEKEVYDRKMAKEIPALFSELKQAANPNLLLKGPPTQREFEEGVRNIIQQVSGTQPKK